MGPLAILGDLRWQDVVDILFLTFVVYHLYLWFWGTKAFKALVGLVVPGILFTASRSWGLFLTTWVFQILWQVLNDKRRNWYPPLSNIPLLLVLSRGRDL